MSKDHETTSDFGELLSALDLQPVRLKPMLMGQFLMELPEHRERADTAHALLVRAVQDAGEVDIEAEPAERQPYLRMLKAAGIKLWKAFDKVRGSQRVADKQMQHLSAAAANGYQLFLALIIKGPAGSGKSMFVDAFKDVLEGRVVYTVEGCPVHENPLNLLKLLSPAAIDRLAKQLHLTEDECAETGQPSLRDMLAVAGDPCQHCWSKIMESCEEDPNKAFLQMNVVPMRLSSRKFGIATWAPGTTLPTALERGSRGMVDMGELFDGAGSGSPVLHPASPNFKMLLEVTNDRRMSAGVTGPTKEQMKAAAENKDEKGEHCAQHDGGGNEPGSYQPLDIVPFGQANLGAWDEFIKSLGKDAGKFTRRFHVFTFPYNTSVTEEEWAYRDRILMMRDQPHFDPMSLKLLALLAVISRLKPEDGLDPVLKARIYDGEKLEVKRASKTTTTSGGMYGVSTSSTPAKTEYWTVKDLWDAASEEEALTGLDMTVMFNMLSEIIDRALKDKRFDRCVSSYEMIAFLRERLKELEKSDGFTEEQRQVIKTCREKYLAAAKSDRDKPGAIESEYRRVLQRQLFEVAAPDFDRRAAEMFERYVRHANAWTQKNATVEETETLPNGRTRSVTVKVDIAYLESVERALGKISTSDREEFRTGLNSAIFAYQRQQRERAAAEGTSTQVNFTWDTLPTLGAGIRKMLNDETKQKLERILKSDLELQDATEDDRRLRAEVFARFNQLGYCTHCLSQAIEYFKLNKLWEIQG